MTTLIDAVQTQEPGSELVELIEIELSDTSSIYLHSGIDTDLTSIQFRDLTTPATIRTYTSIPIELKGVERNTDGASARPSLTVANVLNTFRGLIGDLTNKDLIGKRVIRRQTLKKYLYGESADSNPPVEFPVEKFIIDRVASENKVAINFELAAVMDLEGVKIPGRIVVGKYCGWEYQGVPKGRGGCTWRENSQIKIGTTNYKAYFNIDDEPIILHSDATSHIGTAWSSSTTYGPNNWVTHNSGYWRSNSTNDDSAPSDVNVNWQRIRTYTVWSTSPYNYSSSNLHHYVESGNTIWRLVRTNTNKTPAIGSKYWVRGDLCGKLLNSCKCRFQFDPDTVNNPNTFPSENKDTSKPLPFGGFPGSEKYR